MMSPVTKATAAKTTALAAIRVPRRGIVVSVVRIIPEPYSELMTSTPRTPMISWLMYRPPRLCAVGSKPGPGCPCVATPQLASAPKPTVTTTSASSVQ